ncbi:MAG TPA: hypothetical protein VLA00_14720 [Xanthobacteraceae bacterium]|nr:hypothetical protein [Xanthobacteraceae bacterium]
MTPAIPAIPVSGEMLVSAAAIAFGVAPRAVRTPNVDPRGGPAMDARQALAWVMQAVVDGSDKQRARLMCAPSGAAFARLAARAEARRASDAQFRIGADGLLAGVIAAGRLGLSRQMVDIDPIAEARRVQRDPLRAAKSLPVLTIVAIVERLLVLDDVAAQAAELLERMDAAGAAIGDAGAEAAADDALSVSRDALADELGALGYFDNPENLES